MILLENLMTALRALADAASQQRSWLSPGEREVSSFAEDACQVFDDSALAMAMDLNALPDGWSSELVQALRALRRAVTEVDSERSPRELLVDPSVQRVRNLAGVAVALLERDVSAPTA